MARICSLIALALATLTFGCATPRQFANQIVNSNIAQETAQNQLLLLNIVRAYQRRPMHFTQISAIRMPVGIGNPTFAISTPFGPDFSQQIYNVSTQISITQGVDTAVLNSQEFVRGITTPMPASTMLYYLDQGWPQQLVLHLFVREVEIYDGKKLRARMVNYPENLPELSKFQAAMEGLGHCEISGDPAKDKPYGPVLKRDEVTSLQGLAATKAADLSLSAVGDEANPGYQFSKASKTVELKLTDRVGHPCTVPGAATLLTTAASPERQTLASGTSATLVLRSPEAMLYYLGEIARAQLDGQLRQRGGGLVPADPGFPFIFYQPLRSETYGTAADVSLFNIRRSTGQDSAVSVAYEGQTYSIPKGTSFDRSTYVLSLLTQVLGLQNKQTDLPGTANVRVVQ